MTSLNGYIQGLGSGADRIVRKTGKEIKLSAYNNIDRVIVFNEAGETTQTTLTGKNLYPILLGNDTWADNGQATHQGSGNELTIHTNSASVSSGVYIYNNTVYRVLNSLGDEPRCISFDIVSDKANTVIRVTSGSGHVFTIGTSVQKISINTIGVNFSVYVTNQNNAVIRLSNLQIEKGSTATDYEPYCGGVPSPNPDYPQAIEGIGTKQLDGTYTVSIDYWDDERDERITASGLAYPLYEGDILDFANGKVIRANGFVDMGTLNYTKYSASNGNAFVVTLPNGKVTTNTYNSGIKCTSYSEDTTVNNAYYIRDISCKYGGSYFGTTELTVVDNNYNNASDFKTSVTGQFILYPLASPVEEYITIEGGDISDIGTARVMADGTLTVKYDKVEMAIRKYSSPPDWSKIGYSETPSFILDGFDYSKQIYDSWTSAASYASKYRGDKALKFFPEVDLTGATNYSAMFQESGILSTPPLTIGDGSSTVINSQLMFQTTQIEKIELTTSEATQKVQIANIFNGCTMLKNAKLTLSASGSMQYAFADCNRLERIEDGLETSDVTSISEAFRACSSLLYLYELDLNSCTTCYRAFYNCTSLYSAPYLKNIGNGVNFQQMFWNCSSLKVLPLYNLGNPSNLTNMFQGTGSNLEEASRINILIMLAACTYSGTKTLAHLGFTASMYSAASWQALPHYNDFVSAGWSIGYN